MSSPVLPDDQTEAPADRLAGQSSTVPVSLAEPDATGAEQFAMPESEPTIGSVVVPDRADAPISEITERFFKSLLTKVPLDRIEELHLFSPLRQGGVETGIAVIAAREEIIPVPGPDPLELPLPLAQAVDEGDDGMSIDAVMEPEPVEIVQAVEFEADAGQAVVDVAEPDHVEPDHVEPDHVEPVAQADGAEPTAPVVRHTVYTARYRLVQKGPERGKWESEVVAEAEAPLITVEMVVRGVQRRAGEESDTTRFTQAQIARALRIDMRVDQSVAR